jgi:hypothetical protein
MKRLRDVLAEQQDAAIRKALGVQDDATNTPTRKGSRSAANLGANVRPPSHRRELTQAERESRARETRWEAAQKARRIPTFTELVAKHRAEERVSEAEIAKAAQTGSAKKGLEILKEAQQRDDVITLARKMAKLRSENGSVTGMTIPEDEIAALLGLPVEKVDAILESNIERLYAGFPPVFNFVEVDDA